MAGKTLTQMTETEFKQLLESVRNWVGKKQNSSFDLRIECLRYENIDLVRLKTLLDVVNGNDNIQSIEFSFTDTMESSEDKGIRAEGAKIIAEFLKTNTTICSLSLHGHAIGTEGANALAEALQVNQTLQEFFLRHCAITDISQIATVLKNNQSIKTIDLGSNPLGRNGVTQMAEVLKLNKTLTVLLFDDNPIDDECARIFSEGLKLNDTLEVLFINRKDNTPGKPMTQRGAELFNNAMQDNLSLWGLVFDFEALFGGELVDPCAERLARNFSFTQLKESIINFRKSLYEYSIPHKTKNISSHDLFQTYQHNLQEIKKLKDKYESTAETPVLKEKMNKKLQDAAEALDLAYYGRDADSLELPLEERNYKLATILATSKNQAHREDAKESLLPIYYLLMVRAKSEEKRKMAALVCLVLGAEEAGTLRKVDIAKEYQIENMEEVLKKIKKELNLEEGSQEEKQPEESTEQKVYSDTGKSSFTKFHHPSEGASSNPTPGVSTSPTPTQIKPLDSDEEKTNKIPSR